MPEFKQEAIAPIQFANPVEQYQNLLKAQYLSSEIDKANRIEDEAKGTADAYKNALAVSKNPDGTLDRSKFRAAAKQHLILNNRGQLVPAFDENNAKVDKIEAETEGVKATEEKTKMESLQKTLEAMAEQYDKNVSKTDPHLGQQQAYALEKGFASDPALAWFNARHNITPEQYFERRMAEQQPAGQNPQAWLDHVTHQSNSAKNAADILAQKLQVVDGGDHNDLYQTNQQGKLELAKTTPKKMADHSTRVTVNANQYAASALAKQLGEDTGKAYTALDETARAAPESVADTDRIIGMIASGKVIMGALSDAKLEALRHAKALAGKLSPEDEELLNNSQEVKKYLTSKLLANIAALNKAGLGARTNLVLTKLEQDSAANGTMEPMAALKILLNQRKAVQDSIPRLNEMRKGLANSPDKDVRDVMQTLVKNELPTIPDHPLYQHLVGGTPGAPAGKKYPTPSAAAVQLLRSGRISKETFEDEEHYGKGAAARALTGK